MEKIAISSQFDRSIIGTYKWSVSTFGRRFTRIAAHKQSLKSFKEQDIARSVISSSRCITFNDLLLVKLFKLRSIPVDLFDPFDEERQDQQASIDWQKYWSFSIKQGKSSCFSLSPFLQSDEFTLPNVADVERIVRRVEFDQWNVSSNESCVPKQTRDKIHRDHRQSIIHSLGSDRLTNDDVHRTVQNSIDRNSTWSDTWSSSASSRFPRLSYTNLIRGRNVRINHHRGH